MILKRIAIVFAVSLLSTMRFCASESVLASAKILVDNHIKITKPPSFIVRTSGTKKHFEDADYFMAIGTSKRPSLKVIYYNIEKERAQKSFTLSLPPEYGILAKTVNYRKCYIYKQDLLVTYKGKSETWYTGRVQVYPYVVSFTEISSDRREKFINELCRDENGTELPRLTTIDAAMSDDLTKKKRSVFDHFDFKQFIDSSCDDSRNLKTNKIKDKAGDFVPLPQ